MILMILTVAPAKMAAALYEVSESRISRVERHIATKQLNKLTWKETILDYVNKLCFDEKNHDLSDVEDPGYFSCYDAFMER